MPNKAIALIVDDEPDIRELLTLTLSRMGIEAISAKNIKEAKSSLLELPLNLCLTDMRLPDGDGLQLVEFVQEHYPHIPIAVITAYGNIELAVTALKAGAFDFVSKPVDLHVLRNLVNTACRLSEEHQTTTTTRDLLGVSPIIQELRRKITKLARSQAPVHITGPSGVGKELVARLIHEQGPRSESAFVPVNCGAIPSELMESEFFGHRKGSFTGALTHKEGLFQAAHGGTLFLDEVADLPLAMQVKLLRAIQEKAVRPIGHEQEIPVDVRLLSATHKNIHQLVNTGEFRQDLFYRINVIELAVPSLSERVEDIPLLAEHILAQLTQELAQPPQLTEISRLALQHYAFPGNVRELENILERAIALCETGHIELHDLHLPNISDPEETTATAKHTPKKSAPLPLGSYLDTLEKERILQALERRRWNRTAAAKDLGLTLRALRYRLKKLNIEGNASHES